MHLTVRRALVALVAAALAAVGLGLAASPASAVTETSTVTWRHVGACGSVASTTAPEGAVSMAVTVRGANGGWGGQVAGATGGAGGAGGEATATVPVSGGQVVSAVTGCVGSTGTSSSGPGGAGFAVGGSGGEGHGVLTSDHHGGGGGGASALCLGPACLAGAQGVTPLVVAGGGGGGGSLNCAGTSVGTGGAAGGGSVTSDGAGAGASGAPGGGGLHSSGGAGGGNSTPGLPGGGTGGDGRQGSGTNSGGGGGGAGYRGGAGGTGTSGGAALCAGGGGGGAGSSWVAASGTATSFSTRPAGTVPSVTVTFTVETEVVDHVPFASLDALIVRQHQDLLGRDPTAEELAGWRTAITDGSATADELVVSLLPEDQDALDARVVRLYLAYFLRPPDLDGFRYWRDQLAGGRSLQSTSNLFSGTSEFRARYGSLDDGQFVDLIYRNVLDREAEPAGRAFWTDQLTRGIRSRGWVMTYFSESIENGIRKTAHVGVVRLHLAMLGRMPTKAELAGAVAPVVAGTATAEEVLLTVAHGIRTSPEYATRVGA